MSKRTNLILFLVLLGLSACAGPDAVPTTPEILPGLTETPFQPGDELTPLPKLGLVTPSIPDADTPPSAALSFDQLRNAEYRTLGLSDDTIQTFRLEDGLYRTSTDPAAENYMAVNLIEPYAFGNLNNDELTDAVVILVENYGGTGQFVHIGAVLSRAGQPVHADSFLLGDRVAVNTLDVQNSEIVAALTVHGPEEPACCPSVPANIHLRLINENKLVVTRFTTRTPTGQEHAINIRAPLSGSEVSGAITISGDVTVAPFENNLVYTVYDSNYQQIAQSYITVDAPDLGAPGTFTLTLDLASLGQTGNMYVEISDISAADGSIIALTQIQLIVR
jgi:hypothetical protein